MREIKFRAWQDWDKADTGLDKIDLPKKMFSWEEMLKWNKASLGQALSGQCGELTLMQFTGLLDKNGKEIFEGDILKSPSGILFIVFREKGCFCYKRFKGNIKTSYLKEISEYWEVIGNKFENPELIGEELENVK